MLRIHARLHAVGLLGRTACRKLVTIQLSGPFPRESWKARPFSTTPLEFSTKGSLEGGCQPIDPISHCRRPVTRFSSLGERRTKRLIIETSTVSAEKVGSSNRSVENVQIVCPRIRTHNLCSLTMLARRYGRSHLCVGAYATYCSDEKIVRISKRASSTRQLLLD
jgi:hypothetical protein